MEKQIFSGRPVRGLILADDFTGALDTGVQFAKKGISAVVAADPEALSRDAEILVIDTESRHICFSDAYGKIKDIAGSVLRRQVPMLYKKTDSTLRGNIGAEIAGLLDASGRKAAVFVPSFPRMNRVMRDGEFYVDGVPLTETSYARDPFQPIKMNSVAGIIGAQTDIRVINKKPGDGFTLPDEKCILLYDAESDDDLMKVAESIRGWEEEIVIAGCAGFAEAVSEPMRREKKKSGTGGYKGAILCGSINERTRAQVRYALNEGIPARKLKPEDYLGDVLPDDTASDIERMLKESNCVLLYTAASSDDLKDSAAYADKAGIEKETLSVKVAEGLGRAAYQCIAAKGTEALTVIGGDTLIEVIRSAGSGCVIPEDEILPGVVLCEMPLKGGGSKKLITKAGSFGGEGIIAEIRKEIYKHE